jgi:hypothetical protein
MSTRFLTVPILALALGAASAIPGSASAAVSCEAPLVPAPAEDRCVSAEEAQEIIEYDEANRPSLTVVVRPHHLPFVKAPGYTTVKVEAPEEWAVSVVWRVGGHAYPPKQFPEGDEGGLEARRTWSCAKPGQIVSYVITARGTPAGAVGQTKLTRRGQFRTGSRWWCGQARRIEMSETRLREAMRRQAGEEQRLEVEAERQRREAERRHYEANCRAIGGIPAEIQIGGENRVVCHSKTGGLIPVPT